MCEYPKRDSVILKVEKYIDGVNYCFICNRNSDDFETLYNDKYIRWFEYENIPDIMKISDENDVQILEYLYGWDNYNLRHQRDINSIKQRYLNEIKDSMDDDVVITNSSIKKSKEYIRQEIRDKYNTIREYILNLTTDEIYSAIKTIWFDKRLMTELEKPRYMFMTNCTINTIGCVAIVFKEYLLMRRNNRNMLPLNKENIKKQINKIMINELKLR